MRRSQGEVRTHWRRREPGAAVKHWVKSNAIKMYDKSGRVLRIETVINDPKEFFVHRPRLKNDGTTGGRLVCDEQGCGQSVPVRAG